jgi:hypothetical protein
MVFSREFSPWNLAGMSFTGFSFSRADFSGLKGAGSILDELSRIFAYSGLHEKA